MQEKRQKSGLYQIAKSIVTRPKEAFQLATAMFGALFGTAYAVTSVSLNPQTEKTLLTDAAADSILKERVGSFNFFNKPAERVFENNTYILTPWFHYQGGYLRGEDGNIDVVALNSFNFLKFPKKEFKRLFTILKETAEEDTITGAAADTLNNLLDRIINPQKYPLSDLVVNKANAYIVVHENAHDLWHNYLTPQDRKIILDYSRKKLSEHSTPANMLVAEKTDALKNVCGFNLVDNFEEFEKVLFTNVARAYSKDRFLNGGEVFAYTVQFMFLNDYHHIPAEVSSVYSKVLNENFFSHKLASKQKSLNSKKSSYGIGDNKSSGSGFIER